MSAKPIRTLVAVDGAIDRRTLEGVLDDPGIEVVSVLETHGELRDRAEDGAVAMLVACNGHPDVALAYVAEAVRERPDWPVVVITTQDSPGNLVREVFQAGADDILTITDVEDAGPQTFFALQKALARRTGLPAESSGNGELICVLGPKGGTGKTLTATNLGCALADAGKRTLVVDLDLQFGDLALSLGLEPERTLFDLATSGGTLDVDKLDAYLARHESGLHVLMAPMRPDQAAAVTPEFLRDLYPVLRGAFDFVIVDTPPGFTPEVITSIDAASAIVMVGMLDALSLKNTRLGLETLNLMGVASKHVNVVLNRADSNVGITQADVVRVLGRAPDLLVPSNREVVRSVNLGEPIVLSSKRSDAAKSFRALAGVYTGAAVPAPAEPAPTTGRRRLLGRS